MYYSALGYTIYTVASVLSALINTCVVIAGRVMVCDKGQTSAGPSSCGPLQGLKTKTTSRNDTILIQEAPASITYKNENLTAQISERRTLTTHMSGVMVIRA